MDISLKNIFYGFVNNVVTFHLDRKDFYYGSKKHTLRIINFFASLGESLGFISELEWNRYDLIWLPIDQDLSEHNRKNWVPFLHLESEAAADLQKAETEFEQLFTTKATDLVIGFFYCANAESVKDWITRIKEKFNSFDKDALFILCPIIDVYNDPQNIPDFSDYYGLIREQGKWSLYHIQEPWNKMLMVE